MKNLVASIAGKLYKAGDILKLFLIVVRFYTKTFRGLP